MKIVSTITIVPCHSNYNWLAKVAFFFFNQPNRQKYLTEIKHIPLSLSSTFQQPYYAMFILNFL